MAFYIEQFSIRRNYYEKETDFSFSDRCHDYRNGSRCGSETAMLDAGNNASSDNAAVEGTEAAADGTESTFNGTYSNKQVILGEF